MANPLFQRACYLSSPRYWNITQFYNPKNRNQKKTKQIIHIPCSETVIALFLVLICSEK